MKVFAKCKPNFKLSELTLVNFLQLLYGLAEFGNNGHASFLNHIKKYLSMHSDPSNISLIFKKKSTQHFRFGDHTYRS